MSEFDNEIQMCFLEEATDLLESAEQCFLQLEQDNNNPEIIEEIFRLAHNFKGSAGAVGFDQLKNFAHKFESLLLLLKEKKLSLNSEMVSLLLKCNDHLKTSVESLLQDTQCIIDDSALTNEIMSLLNGDQPSVTELEESYSKNHEMEQQQTIERLEQPHIEEELNIESPSPLKKAGKKPVEGNIRVSLQKIDHLLNNVGELSILQTVLDAHKNQVAIELVEKSIGLMSKIVREIQEVSMGLRMVPLSPLFQKMQRIARDTSKETGKQVKFILSGEDTELDKTVMEQLGDPLVHLIRNAVDHGIETPEERQMAGKDPEGVIHLSAQQKGGQIVIEIQDNGKGIDPEVMVSKAIEKGLIHSTAQLSEKEAQQLVFHPGFSTKQEVTDISGRGVGMDVVKTNVENLQGNIEIESKVGEGTIFRINLPLTMAIIDGAVVSAGDQKFVIPISQVTESIRPKQENLSRLALEGEVLIVRGKPVPLYRIENLLRVHRAHPICPTDGIAVLCEDNEGAIFAVLVDEILCQQQVVIKNLSDEIRNAEGISGAAILGDGKVGLIVDLLEASETFRMKSKQNVTQLRGVS